MSRGSTFIRGGKAQLLMSAGMDYSPKIINYA